MTVRSTIRGSVAELQGEGRGIALLTIASCSFLLIGVQMIYPVLLPELRATYGFDLTMAGVLLAVLWIANAVGQVPGGVLADGIGEGRTMVASTLISGGTLVLIVVANSLVVLFVATFLFGLGIALFGVARYTALDYLFPERVGTTVGIVLAAADAGQAVLPPLAGVIAAIVIWQLGFAFTLPLFVVVAVALWVYVPVKSSDSGGSTNTISRANLGYVGEALRQRTVLYGSAVFVVYVMVWITFTGFYPTYVIDEKGLSSLTAAVLFGTFFAFGVLIKPLSGIAYDRVGIRGSLLTISAISGAALLAFPFLEGVGPIAAATLFIAPILGSGTIAQSHVIEALPSDIKGTALGIVRTGGMTMAAVSPVVFGAVADRGFFDEAFLSLSVLAGVMILLVIRIPPE